MTQSERSFRRTLNRDGTLNVVSQKEGGLFSDFYHRAMSKSWPQLLAMICAVYLCINLVFGLVYAILGAASYDGLNAHSGIRFFLDCFFFSVQTFSTVGYGKISPITIPANLVVTLESFTGLLSVPILTGVFFSKIARPNARIKFSDFALITQHLGSRSLVFRMANARFNQVVEAQAYAVLVKNVVSAEGRRYRLQEDLKLIRSKSSVFFLSWTVAHKIDESSPLFNKSIDELKEMGAEIFVSVMGHDDTFSQTIHARRSYSPDEILWDKQYVDMVERDEQQRLTIHLERISEVE